MQPVQIQQPAAELPEWVPDAARHYLAHTENGHSIRQLAREAGCHASTVLRQVRRYENRRDDPLVDAALTKLGAGQFDAVSLEGAGKTRSFADKLAETKAKAEFEAEALRVLRRLCEAGAVLAVATDMDKAVVVRDTESGTSTRTAVVDAAIAQAMALHEWISCTQHGRVSRYRITQLGRQTLTKLMSQAESRGFAEAQQTFAPQQPGSGRDAGGSRRTRYALAESPLLGLARRKDKTGRAFLSPELVAAGERLREDFELSQMGQRTTQNWDDFLTSGASKGLADSSEGAIGPGAARDRVAAALADLGPGLADMALRCCCYLEGLEIAEKRMGWSARSGKIVLRIALQRLKRHYEEKGGAFGPLIG